MKIVTARQMREIDRECTCAGTPVSVLMENAGQAVAEETRRYLGDIKEQHVLCLVGAGNNGGDGLVAARYLADWGAEVGVYLCSERSPGDANLEMVRERKIKCVAAGDDKNLEELDKLLKPATCVIDALLGTGKMRPLEGIFKGVLEKVAAEKKKCELSIVAVDLPSGMDADTGAIDPACPDADVTVTLAFPKPGLFIFPGAARVGKLVIADIGIPASLAGDVTLELLTGDWAGVTLPERPLDANKGSFGRVMVVAGCINFIGAAYLASGGALRGGAALVTLAMARSLQPVIAARLADVTYLPLPETAPGFINAAAADVLQQEIGQYRVMLIGCGLGQHPDTVAFLRFLLGKKGLPPLVIDADGLNIISKVPELQRQLSGDAILTPHPGEMSRLCGLPVSEIQADRINIARKYAREWQKTLVLKGACSVIAAADGRCRVSPFANPGLASAGTGDVLAGVIAGLAAQGLSLFEAASLGIYLHGAAGEAIKDVMGDTGMIASDLLSALPIKIKDIREKKGRR